jgi:hypothetical protein
MINFVQFINQNTPQLTAAQKTAMLDDMCLHFAYQEVLLDGIPNPQSKADFVNALITNFIKSSVQRQRQMALAASAEVLDI